MKTSRSLRSFYGGSAVVLAPMEDVSDPAYRKICRSFGATLCFTEFVNADSLLRNDRHSQRKLVLQKDDQPTAIQIYGGDPASLVEAARIAEAAGAAFIDINCGCWIPRIIHRGAGAGWLREPRKMIEMAARVVEAVSLPVTVKTRIGWGGPAESDMPIVDLAPRLEDVGVSALTIHCRTAVQRHDGFADWQWAKRAQAVVSMPVIVNGDVRTAEDCKRALAETGCAGVMIGRAAMAHPWVFREARALLDHGVTLPGPTPHERLTTLMEILSANVACRGAKNGMFCTRRHYPPILAPLPFGQALKEALFSSTSYVRCLELLDSARARLSEMAA